jgi:hypothetical protein
LANGEEGYDWPGFTTVSFISYHAILVLIPSHTNLFHNKNKKPKINLGLAHVRAKIRHAKLAGNLWASRKGAY